MIRRKARWEAVASKLGGSARYGWDAYERGDPAMDDADGTCWARKRKKSSSCFPGAAQIELLGSTLFKNTSQVFDLTW
ncbi:hypothetical protein K9U39_03900 [Rhodoblastus acidophilus]|nr:hypothetical protein [Rhodoblastus acidophilus]